MPAYTAKHRRRLSAAGRNARADWLMAVITGLILAVVAGAGAFFAVRHGASFMHGG